MKTKKIKVTKENFGDLLLESMEQALDHAKGKITLKSKRLELVEKDSERFLRAISKKKMA